MSTILEKKLHYPKHWLSWIIAGVIFLLVKLMPYKWLMTFGSVLGKIMEKAMPYRMLVAQTNIRMCFENSSLSWEKIYENHISNLGKGLFEMAMGWFLPSTAYEDRVLHQGYEAVDNALAQGRGVLFLGVHTTNLDFGAPLLNSRYPTSPMYKIAKNAVLDHIIIRSRKRHCPDVIKHTNLRGVLEKLHNGQCVWYGCDQDFGDNAKSVFANFFGVSAYTLPYYAQLAKKTNAAVIPVAGFRDDENDCFVVKYHPEIHSDTLDPVTAAETMNKAIETLLTGYEDQYYWVHRRFKTRPQGEREIYPRKPSQVRREQREAQKQAKQSVNNK